jgi:hypothetical protein
MIPLHTRVGPGAGHWKADPAAKHTKVPGADGHHERELSVLLGAEPDDPHRANTGRAICAVISRRKRRLGMSRARPRRQRPPHRWPIPPRPCHREPLRRVATVLTRIDVRTPNKRAAHDRREHDYHTAQAHRSARLPGHRDAPRSPGAPTRRTRSAARHQHDHTRSASSAPPPPKPASNTLPDATLSPTHSAPSRLACITSVRKYRSYVISPMSSPTGNDACSRRAFPVDEDRCR